MEGIFILIAIGIFIFNFARKASGGGGFHGGDHSGSGGGGFFGGDGGFGDGGGGGE